MQSTWAAKIFGDREDPRRRLQVIFGGEVPTGGQPPEPALVWARDVVPADVTERGDVVAVTKHLREAEPRLTLRAATFLATHVISA